MCVCVALFGSSDAPTAGHAGQRVRDEVDSTRAGVFVG